MPSSTLDTKKIKKAIQAGIPLSITTYTLPHEMEMYMAEVLSAFLKELNQEFMTEYLIYCMNELVTNAKKANTKRVYFREKCLDIKNERDYDLGMETFKKDTLENIKYWLHLQKEAGYYIKTVLHAKNGKIKFEVRNNAELTLFEYKRIHDKIARAQEYNSVDEAFSQILDDTEGAGLGIVIMILMLQKVGLTDENFRVHSKDGETITRIILPLNESTQEEISSLSKDLVDLIDELPQFPENIIEINKLLADPESKLSDIAIHISNDISLTAELLKLANSAAFSRLNKCHSIHDAVKMVGTRGLQNMLLSVGSIQSLGNSTQEQKELWHHSYRVAFYSYNLARNFFPSSRQIIDDSYVCGLLHDMGRVIFDSAHPHLIKKFRDTCQAKALTPQLFEKMAAGVNHAEIGAQIAEKWNFPEVISSTIRYHHSPETAPDTVKNLASLIYIANMMSHYEDGSVEFYQFDKEILELIHVSNEKQLQQISSKLKIAFDENSD